MSPRLFWQVASLEARTAMSYRLDFWLNATMQPLAQFVVSYYLWAALFAESGQAQVAGYGFQGVVAYYLAAILLGRMVRGKDMDNVIATEIYEGQLNRFLVFPTGYFGYKYAEHLGRATPLVVQATVLAGLGVAFLRPEGPALAAVPADWPARAAMTLIAVLVGNLLNFTFLAAIQCVAFWADNVWSLVIAQRMASSILGGLMIPLALFPPTALAVLEWLPFRFFFSVPARTLLGELPPAEWAGAMAIGLAWIALSTLITRAVWTRGQYRYTGVGI